MKINMEVDENAQGSSFLIPVGKYPVRVLVVDDKDDDGNDKRSRAGDPQFSLKLEVHGHKTWVWNTLTLIPKGKPGHGIAVHALKCFGISIEKSSVNFETQDLKGKTAMAELGIKKNEEGKEKNEVKTYDYLTEKIEWSPIEEEVPF